MATGIPIPLDAAGIYTLLPPFENALVPGVIYVCISSRRLADCLTGGEDPFEKYYEPMGMSKEEYENDLISGECIVSLQSSSGIVVYVPNRLISGLPQIGGVRYSMIILSANLGVISSEMDLSYLRQKLADTILETVGIGTGVGVVAASEEILVSYEQDEQVQTARLANIQITNTDHTLYVQERALRIQAQQKIAQLEAYIKSKYIP